MITNNNILMNKLPIKSFESELQTWRGKFKKELQLWKVEVSFFLKTISSQEIIRLPMNEKKLMLVIEKELKLLEDFVFPIHEQELSRNIVTGVTLRKIHGNLRLIINRIKIEALPILSKMMPIVIH
ncbi:MAG: hypothetical protein MK226_08765 [Saprospiraceae bacterium]|nr:hypothetical protein [Saprospiraceae bacterium]